jgi:DNA invertase Pin-like site-specific DNA recombinase
MLFVRPFEKKKTISFDNYKGNQTNAALMKEILSNLCLGNDVSINGQIINDDNRKMFHDVFINLYTRSYNHNKEKQAKGIETAKKEGSFKGRKPIKVDEMLFLELLTKVENKEITPKEAAKELGISIDKYYRVKRKLQK